MSKSMQQNNTTGFSRMGPINMDTYLVILKIHGGSIHLYSQDKVQLLSLKTHSLRIACRNSEQSSSTNIQKSLFTNSIYDDSTYKDMGGFNNSDKNVNGEKCQFQEQDIYGERIELSDLITFMTKPVDNSTKASFIIDIMIADNKANINTSIEDLTDNKWCERIGQAFVYLDHKFSSQGIQRTPIVFNHNQIGQLEISYLIVTNPIAFGKKGLKPEWMYTSQLDAGHRGAGVGHRKDLPNGLLENTIASFNFAHRNGADLCELDVILSADGIPVVYHDFDVDAVAKQQSRDDLGKSRYQVNEFTVEQMRDLSLLSLHDEEGCQYTININNQDVINRPFPTLAEVLSGVHGGLNIELKWPQLLESGKMQARKYCEINQFVDKVIDVIETNEKSVITENKPANYKSRPIVLSTFDVDIAILLRLKQVKYPVLFLTTGDKSRFNDPITKTVENAIHFAEAFDLTGINPNAAKVTGKLVKYAHDRGQLVYAWGKIETPQAIQELKRTGLNGVIYDKIDLIKPKN